MARRSERRPPRQPARPYQPRQRAPKAQKDTTAASPPPPHAQSNGNGSHPPPSVEVLPSMDLSGLKDRLNTGKPLPAASGTTVDLGTLCESARNGTLDTPALAALVVRLHRAHIGIWEISSLVGQSQPVCQELIKQGTVIIQLQRAELRNRELNTLEMIREEAWAAWLRSADPQETIEYAEEDAVVQKTGEVVTLKKKKRTLRAQQRDSRYLRNALDASTGIMNLEGLAKPREERDGDDDMESGLAVEIEYTIINEPKDDDDASRPSRSRKGRDTRPGAKPPKETDG